MRLITSLRFRYLTIPTPHNYVLGQITVGKTRITNDQELLVSSNNLPYHSLNELTRIGSKNDKLSPNQ